ncbi:hypothetical protein D3C83_133820 [compost metagenome]
MGEFGTGSSRREVVCEIEYRDYREPFLVLSVSVSPWLRNSVFLEPGKASLLGVTNLREAIVLIVRRVDEE